MNQEKIGKFIAKCRKEKKLTQTELAEKLGVTEKSISNWENGRNMPDLSLFKPLCKELDISINDLMRDEKVEEKDYKKKLEENIINTIDYSNHKFSIINKNMALILITLGIVISIFALTIFESERMEGAIYAVLGGVISLLGISKLTKKLSYPKRILFNYGYFILFIIMLFTLDYLGVIINKQAPRFFYEKETTDNMIVYKTLLYNVYRINYDTKNEYYIVDTKKEYTKETVPLTPFNRKKAGINNIIKYQTESINNKENLENLINCLPLSEYGYDIKIDSKNLKITINYHNTNWYINENYYLEKSLIYNSISIFALIDDIEYIQVNFNNNSYHTTRKEIQEIFPNFKYIKKDKVSKANFNKHLENEMNNNEFIKFYFKEIFVDRNITKTKKIEVYTYEEKTIQNDNEENEYILVDSILKTITDETQINNIIDILLHGKTLPPNALTNSDGETWRIIMYDENNIKIQKLYVWYYGFFGTNGKEYEIDSENADKLSSILGIYYEKN